MPLYVVNRLELNEIIGFIKLGKWGVVSVINKGRDRR